MESMPAYAPRMGTSSEGVPLLDQGIEASDSVLAFAAAIPMWLRICTASIIVSILLFFGTAFYFVPHATTYVGALLLMVITIYGVSLRDTSTSKGMVTSTITGGVAAIITFYLASEGGYQVATVIFAATTAFIALQSISTSPEVSKQEDNEANNSEDGDNSGHSSKAVGLLDAARNGGDEVAAKKDKLVDQAGQCLTSCTVAATGNLYARINQRFNLHDWTKNIKERGSSAKAFIDKTIDDNQWFIAQLTQLSMVLTSVMSFLNTTLSAATLVAMSVGVIIGFVPLCDTVFITVKGILRAFKNVVHSWEFWTGLRDGTEEDYRKAMDQQNEQHARQREMELVTDDEKDWDQEREERTQRMILHTRYLGYKAAVGLTGVTKMGFQAIDSLEASMMPSGTSSTGDKHQSANPLKWVAITTEGMPQGTEQQSMAYRSKKAEMDGMMSEGDRISNAALENELEKYAWTFDFGNAGWPASGEKDQILQWHKPIEFTESKWDELNAMEEVRAQPPGCFGLLPGKTKEQVRKELKKLDHLTMDAFLIVTVRGKGDKDKTYFFKPLEPKGTERCRVIDEAGTKDLVIKPVPSPVFRKGIIENLVAFVLIKNLQLMAGCHNMVLSLRSSQQLCGCLKAIGVWYEARSKTRMAAKKALQRQRSTKVRASLSIEDVTLKPVATVISNKCSDLGARLRVSPFKVLVALLNLMLVVDQGASVLVPHIGDVGLKAEMAIIVDFSQTQAALLYENIFEPMFRPIEGAIMPFVTYTNMNIITPTLTFISATVLAPTSKFAANTVTSTTRLFDEQVATPFRERVALPVSKFFVAHVTAPASSAIDGLRSSEMVEYVENVISIDKPPSTPAPLPPPPYPAEPPAAPGYEPSLLKRLWAKYVGDISGILEEIWVKFSEQIKAALLAFLAAYFATVASSEKVQEQLNPESAVRAKQAENERTAALQMEKKQWQATVADLDVSDTFGNETDYDNVVAKARQTDNEEWQCKALQILSSFDDEDHPDSIFSILCDHAKAANTAKIRQAAAEGLRKLSYSRPNSLATQAGLQVLLSLFKSQKYELQAPATDALYNVLSDPELGPSCIITFVDLDGIANLMQMASEGILVAQVNAARCLLQILRDFSKPLEGTEDERKCLEAFIHILQMARRGDINDHNEILKEIAGAAIDALASNPLYQLKLQAAIEDLSAILQTNQKSKGDAGAEMRQHAAAALARLTHEASDNARKVMQVLGKKGFEALVDFLVTGRTYEKEMAAWALQNVSAHQSIKNEIQSTIVEAGGIRAIVQVLQTGSFSRVRTSVSMVDAEASGRSLQLKAAGAMHNLSFSQYEHPEMLDAIGPLIRLMEMGDLKEQRIEAAGALCNLGLSNTLATEMISTYKIVPKLISIVNGHEMQSALVLEAVRTIHNLARREVPNSKETMDTVLIKRLVELLQTGGDALKSASVGAFRNFAILAAITPELTVMFAKELLANENAAILALVDLGRDGTTEQQAEATDTLNEISLIKGLQPESTLREAISEAGAVETIIKRAKSDNTKQQLGAVVALRNLAADVKLCSKISSKGGIPALINLVETGNRTLQLNAIIALGRIAYQSEARQRAIAKSGGIRTMVQATNSGSITFKKEAILVLKHLSENRSNRKEIVAAGGLPLIYEALKPESQIARESFKSLPLAEQVVEKAALVEHAVLALHNLVADNDKTQKDVATATGIVQIIMGLVESGATPIIRAQAAAVVGRLGSLPANRRILLQAGAKAVLENLRTNGSSEGRKEAAKALASLTEFDPESGGGRRPSHGFA